MTSKTKTDEKEEKYIVAVKNGSKINSVFNLLNLSNFEELTRLNIKSVEALINNYGEENIKIYELAHFKPIKKGNRTHIIIDDVCIESGCKVAIFEKPDWRLIAEISYRSMVELEKIIKVMIEEYGQECVVLLKEIKFTVKKKLIIIK